ncbi:hypothetical protein, partial [Escherichia coli]|uniref:hypothetical protein n=1 Tax=Escherichia coli TaxID=562 RepID=UPI0010CC7B86
FFFCFVWVCPSFVLGGFFGAVCQGGGAYGKTPGARLSSYSWSFAHMFFPVLSPGSVDNSISFLSE